MRWIAVLMLGLTLGMSEEATAQVGHITSARGMTQNTVSPVTLPPDQQTTGIDMGDLATWFSGIFTAGLFVFTLHAWRQERRLNVEREEAIRHEKAVSEANLVACWIEKSSVPLRRRTGVDAGFLPDGTWALILENGATFALFHWSVRTEIKNPSYVVSIDSGDKGPIGPNGGLLVLPLTTISKDATPTISIQLEFRDEKGGDWFRGESGLAIKRAIGA